MNTTKKRKKSSKKYNFKAVDFFIFLYDTLGETKGIVTMIFRGVKS